MEAVRFIIFVPRDDCKGKARKDGHKERVVEATIVLAGKGYIGLIKML